MSGIDEFRAGQRAAWGAGDFDEFARMIWPIGARLVERLDVGAGDEVVDIGCGTGNVAIQAAEAGARVTGVDLAPEMLARARADAERAGLEITFVEGDAENLPLPDAAADVAVSNFGLMFAPRHEIAVAEMLRVVRPGGRFGMTAWEAAGPVAAFLGLTAPYMPPPPGFAQPPVLWGDEAHIRAVFDHPDCAQVEIEREEIPFVFASPDEAVSLYTERFGPLVAARTFLEPRGTWPDLVADVRAFFDGLRDPDGRTVLRAGHLLITGRRR
jgi:SAM-dependent methyltransferase